jgi:multidrug efflux pump subunit AcrA (membrane-fusion protein)
MRCCESVGTLLSRGLFQKIATSNGRAGNCSKIPRAGGIVFAANRAPRRAAARRRGKISTWRDRADGGGHEVTASLYRDQRVLAPREPAEGTDRGRRSVRSRPSGRRRRWPDRQTTRGQRLAGLTMTVACVLGSGWYVQHVVGSDQRVLTGSVTSTGVLDLNFGAVGVVAKVLVRVGQQVQANQLLATEQAPGAAAIQAADKAAVAADKEQLRALSGTQASTASIRAQLARDEARLATDRQASGQRRIVAPAAGVVTAVDAGPGQSAAPAGIRDYVGQQSPVDPAPLFSLLPKSPQVGTKAGMSGSATLPMIQLRTSGDWQVLVLVPEGSAAAVRAGRHVRISVPAAGLAGLAGVIKEVLADPVVTADGNMYEAVVTIESGRADPPLDGMTANVALQPPLVQAASRARQ